MMRPPTLHPSPTALVLIDLQRTKAWPNVQRQIEGLSLPEAHRLVVARAEGVLPFEPAQGAES